MEPMKGYPPLFSSTLSSLNLYNEDFRIFVVSWQVLWESQCRHSFYNFQQCLLEHIPVPVRGGDKTKNREVHIFPTLVPHKLKISHKVLISSNKYGAVFICLLLNYLVIFWHKYINLHKSSWVTCIYTSFPSLIFWPQCL